MALGGGPGGAAGAGAGAGRLGGAWPRRRDGLSAVGSDPGDGGAVADSVRLPDGDVVRADLRRAVDPAQRDRHPLGPADAGADRVGDGADHRGHGPDGRADVRRHRADAGDGGRRRSDQRRDDRGAGDRRRQGQGAAARVSAQAHRRAAIARRSSRWRSRCARRPTARR